MTAAHPNLLRLFLCDKDAHTLVRNLSCTSAAREALALPRIACSIAMDSRQTHPSAVPIFASLSNATVMRLVTSTSNLKLPMCSYGMCALL